MAEHPTITYTPLAGEEFATRMLTPIPLDSIMLFEQSGWRADRLLLVAVQRINDVFNAPTANGPTPERKPDYEAFADLAERLERLRSARLMGLNWEMKEHETDPPGRNPRFWLRAPADPNSPLAADVAAVRRLLDLEPGKDDFFLTAFPFKRHAQRSRPALPVLARCAVLPFQGGGAARASTSRRASSRSPWTTTDNRSIGRRSPARS